MKPPTCITGDAFSPVNEAILWTHAMARGYTANVWVPESLVERLQLQQRGHRTTAPVGINAENGRRFFYNLSQLECLREEVEGNVARLLSTSSCTPVACPFSSDIWPLNTNGERLPLPFAREVHARFAPQHDGVVLSRYWATVDEAEFIFDSPFKTTFLTGENAVTLFLDDVASRVKYYNVCGTIRPDVFNANTCRRYHPVNVCGRLYTPSIATHMKASAIHHGCMRSRMWLTTRCAAQNGVVLLCGVKPLTFFFDDVFHFVNVAMTLNPARLMDGSLLRTSPGLSDDHALTVP